MRSVRKGAGDVRRAGRARLFGAPVLEQAPEALEPGPQDGIGGAGGAAAKHHHHVNRRQGGSVAAEGLPHQALDAVALDGAAGVTAGDGHPEAWTAAGIRDDDQQEERI